jgi:TonB family protein
METMRNPGINFPVSGLAAVIVTLMLLIFNYNLSRIYIPIRIIDRPPPVTVTYEKPQDQLETEKTEIITKEPIIDLINRDSNPVNTTQPVTVAPVVPHVSIDRPADKVIPKVNAGFDFRTPDINKNFTLEQVDRRPRVLRPVTPIYPYQATVNGIEGRVVLRFIVDENGEVQDPVVVKAEPEGVFEEAALAAIVKYKFIPATIGKKNVKCIATMPVGFKIN